LEQSYRDALAMAYQEGERAKTMENPTTRGPIEVAGSPFTLPLRRNSKRHGRASRGRPELRSTAFDPSGTHASF
jgi:hypothetical protein